MFTYRAVVGSLPLVFLCAATACGGGASANKPVEPATPPSASTSTSSSTPPREGGGPKQATPLVAQGAAMSDDEAPDPETPDQIFGRVRADLARCYEQGKKAAPAMTSGRATLDVSVDATGSAACVVVSDDTGLTQEVEDCMSERLSRERFKPNGATWATELPVVVKEAAVTLGPPATAAPALETVETHGLPDSAHDVVESLLPQLHECTSGASSGKSPLRVIHVGARIGKDGRVQCALASSAGPMPVKVRSCAANVLASAKFPAPRSAVGLVSVPVKVLARK